MYAEPVVEVELYLQHSSLMFCPERVTHEKENEMVMMEMGRKKFIVLLSCL